MALKQELFVDHPIDQSPFLGLRYRGRVFEQDSHTQVRVVRYGQQIAIPGRVKALVLEEGVKL